MKSIFTLLISLFFLTSCYNEQDTISIGYNDWIGNDPLIIANKLKFFEKEGVKVKLHYFTSLYDVMRAFSEEKIDVMFATANETLLLADKGEKLKIVLLTNYSNGADAIVAKKSIVSIKNLKGKKIGVEFGSVSHFMLLKALQKANINSEKVTLINTIGKESISKFKMGEIDAVVTWVPFIDEAIKNHGHVIFSSKEISGEIIDVVSIRQSIIDKYPEDCYKIVSAYLKTLDWFHDNQEQGLEIISKMTHSNIIDLKTSFAGVQLARVNENEIAFGTPAVPGKIYSTISKLIIFSKDNNLISHTLIANTLIDPQCVLRYISNAKKGNL